MKRLFLFILIICSTSYAGLPPTSSKDSTDTGNITTFNYQFPNFTGTHTGVTFSLGVNGVAGGGTGTGTAFTAGSVLFAGASGVYSQNNSQLFWDNSNNRLGIGTASPSNPLTINTTGTTGNIVMEDFFTGNGAVGQILGVPQTGGGNEFYLNTVGVTTGLQNWIAFRFGASGNKWFFGDDGANAYFQTLHAMYFGPNAAGNPSQAKAGATLSLVSFTAGINQVTPGAALEVDSQAVGNITLLAKSVASQTANIFNVEASGGQVDFSIDKNGQFRTGNSTPAIAANACGTTSQGTVSGTNQSGLVTVGTALITVCTISWSTTLGTAPTACLISPANTTAAATGTVAAYISSVSTTNFVITGTALASAAYYYHCY